MKPLCTKKKDGQITVPQQAKWKFRQCAGVEAEPARILQVKENGEPDRDTACSVKVVESSGLKGVHRVRERTKILLISRHAKTF